MIRSSTKGQTGSVSMLAQLLELGESLHGTGLSVFIENYPQGYWNKAIIPNHEILLGIEDSRYTSLSGLRALRQELATRDAVLRSQLFLCAENIAVTQGATHALNVVLQTFGGPDVDVLIPAPSYSGYRDICQVLRLPYRPYVMDDSGTWLTDELLASLRQSSIMIVNTPHNPSGGQIDTDQLIRLVKRVRETGALVLFDSVYDELVYEGKPAEWNLIFKAADDLDSFIWINSFSKNFGFPGVRLGWITATAATIRMMEAAIESSILCLPDYIQRWASLAVSRMSGTLVQEMKLRREYLCAKLSGVAGLEFKRPTAGLTVMARLRSGTAMDLVQRLLRSNAALFLPGHAYYGGDPQTIRLCFGYSRTEIDRYVDILASVLGRRLEVLSSTQIADQQQTPFVSV
jgi:aspartate/methionine/tyrosine aminotransferase